MNTENSILDILKQTTIDISKSDNFPLIIFLGGQPGCGKTALIESVKNEYSNRDFCIIDADNYRQFHPNLNLLKKCSTTAVIETSKFANDLELHLIEYALKQKKNIIHVSTLRATDTMLNLIYNYAFSSGYKVGICAMSVPFLESALSCEERYETQLSEPNSVPRFTSFDFMKSSDDCFINTIKILENDSNIEFINVYKRCDNTLPERIYSSRSADNEYSCALDAIYNNRSSQEKQLLYNNLNQRLQHLYDLKTTRNADKVEFESLEKLSNLLHDYMSNRSIRAINSF